MWWELNRAVEAKILEKLVTMRKGCNKVYFADASISAALAP
jgi:hypothetical protein